jgi:predicted patatin/cPLA2 family phospholipase
MRNFCIVAQGGGMVSAYHVGVIKALKERFGFSKLNLVVTSSGAAATYSYLISNQESLIKVIWEDLLKSGKFIHPWKFPIGKGALDIDFLIDEIIKRRFPFDLETFMNSPVKFETGVTDAKTGQSRFFSKNDPIDFYELLRASCSVPYFSRQSVNLGSERYYDGTIGSVSGIEKVLNEENILIILTRPSVPLTKMFLLRKFLKWLLIRKETPELQKAVWDMVREYDRVPFIIKELGKDKNVAVIQPKRRLPMFRIDNRLSRLRRTIEQGYNDTISNSELDVFFNKF